MATYKNFEDTPAWQAASVLYNLVMDLLDDHSARFTPGFRNQLDRAALSVSNNIAEGFERVSVKELLSFLAIARGSAGEVRSMCLVVRGRKKSLAIRSALDDIGAQARACCKQITGWIGWLEESDIQGKRHQTPEVKARRKAETAASSFRSNFLLSLKPSHPLFNTREAKAARGEE